MIANSMPSGVTFPPQSGFRLVGGQMIGPRIEIKIMNIKQLEALLVEIRDDYSCNMRNAVVIKLNEAIAYCRQQQVRRAKRKLQFELRAAEQRELLR